MSRRRNTATELKIADALAEQEAWDEGSGISEDDLWAFIQPGLPRGEAGREYARKKEKKAASMTQAERIAAGQRMFFEDSLKVMAGYGQIQQDGKLWLGNEPLWQKASETGPLEIYVPGSRRLRDAEAEQRIQDRKLRQRILQRRAFEISPDSPSYQLVLTSMRKYGYRREYPILVDAHDPSNVLVGRTRLAVAEALEEEQPGITEQVRQAAVKVETTGTDSLHELLRADVFRRHLDKADRDAALDILRGSEASQAEVDAIEAVIKERDDKVQRRREAKRARIEELLLEDASRSDRSIGDLTGAKGDTVTSIRRRLESSAQIGHWVFPGGELGSKGILASCCETGQHQDGPEPERGKPEPDPPKPPTGEQRHRREHIRDRVPAMREADPDRSDTSIAQEIASSLHCNPDTVFRDWDALAGEGQLLCRRTRAQQEEEKRRRQEAKQREELAKKQLADEIAARAEHEPAPQEPVCTHYPVQHCPVHHCPS